MRCAPSTAHRPIRRRGNECDPSLSPELLPLLADRDPDAPLAWRAGVPVSAREFLADVARLAPQLPDGGPVVNLCTERYAFTLGLAAALLRGQTSLLPPDARPDTLARLVEQR